MAGAGWNGHEALTHRHELVEDAASEPPLVIAIRVNATGGSHDHARNGIVGLHRRHLPGEDPVKKGHGGVDQAHGSASSSTARWRRSAPMARKVRPRMVPARRPMACAASSAERPATKRRI